ncbi:MAG TPA: hypothetical protein VFE21_01330 [Rubrobacteraceae bacterium]|nr:hypothetical protein [Rubrobacteraceae bacterium]
MRVKRFVKSGFLILMTVVLYLIAANSGAGWMYVVAAALAATVLVSLPAPLLNVRGLKMVRRVPATGTVGEPLDCRIEIKKRRTFREAPAGSKG